MNGEDEDLVLSRKLAEATLAAAETGDIDRLRRTLLEGIGLPRHAATGQLPVTIHRWVCPVCDGDGRAGDGGRCHFCAGYGLTNDIRDPAAWPGLRAAPRPPAVMRSPCVDCAYRPGSPEDPGPYGEEIDCGNASFRRPDASTPFFCHHGMHRVGDGYESPAYVGTLPLGAMVCAGWWARALDEELPDEHLRPFRDPGGAARPEAAPEVP
jgi:hypothetical protein